MCGTCSDLQSVIVRARTEDARKRSFDELTEHMRHANEARDHYRHMIAKAKDALAEVQQDDDAELRFEHYTFDFAKQATIPHHAREIGALYFKVPRRIQIFGIAAEAVPSQYNYLFDEDQAIGIDGSKSHGLNAVLSMLHHHLQHHSRAKSICLHADNCCGQNKYKSVLAYLAWRVIVGLNNKIELSFMRVGHMRCFVDGGFGLLRQRYRRSDVDTVQQRADATEESAALIQQGCAVHLAVAGVGCIPGGVIRTTEECDAVSAVPFSLVRTWEGSGITVYIFGGQVCYDPQGNR